MTFRRTAVPLAIWAAAGAVLGGAVVVAGAVALGSRYGARGLAGADVIVAGAALTVVVAVVVAVVADRFAGRLRGLRTDAARRLEDGAVPSVRRSRGALVSELVELRHLLDALALRARVSDELAERNRRSAETASVGMFELLSGLVAAEESARGQLSAELHDTVAQSLALARMALQESVPDGAARAVEFVSDAEEQVRAVMARTRPPALREGDLASAVDSLRADLAERYGVTVNVRWPRDPYPL
ncbi:MAG: hypothetical protein ABR520_13010, partial [Mycobacteriales bacterium]